MRKRIFGRRLKRDTNERKALFRSLMGSLVLHGKIRTTEAKAKSIKGEVEKLVTHAKKDGENALTHILKTLPNQVAADKIIKEIAPKFATRAGGYTRIISLTPRIKDGAKQVLITWVEEISVTDLGSQKRNAGKQKTENGKQKTRSASSGQAETKKETKKETKSRGAGSGSARK